MPFFRPRRLSADFIQVPHEPSRAELTEGCQIDREVVVAAFDRLAAYARSQGRQDIADLVLDERAAIRPARVAEVPVIPGRPT